jgi:hypothetical protein
VNYYGIWISFSDRSNLFFDPAPGQLVALPEGQSMPNEFFFLRAALKSNMEKAEKICRDFCSSHTPTFHLSEIRPQDPDYETIYRFRNPPHYPGGPPAASEEDFPDPPV